MARALCNQVAQSNPCPSRLLASFANSSPFVQPIASVHFLPAAAGAHELTSGNKPSFAIPESAAPGTHQTISGPPVASTGTHFAQVSSQFHKAGVFLCFLALLPKPRSHRF